MKQLLATTLMLALCATSLAAEEKTSQSKDKASIINSDDFRCERLTGVSLADFKSKLVENCNLNKPFSSSLSRVLNEDNYFYCCQKR